MCASPLDPLATNVGQVALGSMSSEQVEKLEAYWGVNTPPVERYLGWLGSVLQGDFGTSLLYRQPVLAIIGERLGNSIWVLAFSWIFSGLLGMALGVLAGVFRGRLPDRCIRGYCLLISSTPAFWLALLLLLIFSVWLGWLPIGLSVPIGVESSAVSLLDRLRHAILPALTLTTISIGSLMRYTRTNTLEALNADYVRTARAKGLPEKKVINKHAFRNTMIPLVTLMAGILPSLFGGAMITETVFSIPGIGKLAYDALIVADVPFIMGYNVFIAVLTVIGTLLSDLMYAIVDPRVKLGR